MNEIAVTYTIDDEEIKLTQKIVSEYLAKGAQITMPEFKMFASLCKARGLNPFLREAYIVKYGDAPAQIIVGKDVILKRAILNPDFEGREQGVIVVNTDGDIIEKSGTFLTKDETLVGGWAKAYRKNWKFPVYVTVAFSEVAQKKRDGSLNSQWATKGATMCEKVALVRALRESFVDETGGLFDESEINEPIDVVPIQYPPIIQDDPMDEVAIDDDGVIDINSL